MNVVMYKYHVGQLDPIHMDLRCVLKRTGPHPSVTQLGLMNVEVIVKYGVSKSPTSNQKMFFFHCRR